MPRYPESERSTDSAEETGEGILEESELNLNCFPLSTLMRFLAIEVYSGIFDVFGAIIRHIRNSA